MRVMDLTRTVHAHKLSGASGSRAGGENFPQCTVWTSSVAAVGQFYSRSIYQQPRRASASALMSLVKPLWLWRDIILTAQHIPRVSTNTAVDKQSRLEKARSDWILARKVFQKINPALWLLEVDFSVSRLTHQLPRFFSWKPDPLPEAIDAFKQDWSKMTGHANHPWCLIGQAASSQQDTGTTAQEVFWQPHCWGHYFKKVTATYYSLLILKVRVVVTCYLNKKATSNMYMYMCVYISHAKTPSV